MHTIHHGDAVAWAREYAGDPFHALLCDAPYEMGFMSKGWDASGVAFDPETWRAFARVLYPGAYLLVFAGTLNDDLISVAMRHAGLRKHHKMLSWSYGSGFPKATRIDTQIDKRMGATGTRTITENASRKRGMQFSMTQGGAATYHATTDLARTWQGHRYGQQALKPALEPILIFQKPYDDSPIDSITATGAGAINVDGARIPSSEQWAGRQGKGIPGVALGPRLNTQTSPSHEIGRRPANLLLSHSPDCNGVCAPACPVARLGQQSGATTNGYRINPSTNKTTWFGVTDGSHIEHERGYNDTGTAARYFFQSDYLPERLEQVDALAYYAKANRSEREAGLDPVQVVLMRDFYGIEDAAEFDEHTINDGRQKSIDNPYQRGETERRNTHPTVKPIALCRHLATLLLPPDAYAPRRLFIPFAGVASEVIGAMLAGWEHVDGVELDETHVKIARARMAYWQQQRHKFNGGQAIKIKSSKTPEQQSSMFDL